MHRRSFCIHQENKDQTAALVRIGLTGVSFFPVVVQIRIPGVDPFDATFIRVLNEGDILPEATVQNNHAWRLKKDAFVLVTVVVGVNVLLRIRKLLDVTGPTDPC